MTDENFVKAIESLNVNGIASVVGVWVGSEYGHVQDWAADPEGKEILKLLGVEDENKGNDTSGLQRANSRYAQDVRHNLDGWKAEYQRLLKKYNKKYVQELEKRLQAAKEPAKGQGLEQSPLRRGYSHNRSIRALQAEALGARVWSDWNKTALLEVIEVRFNQTINLS